MKEFPKKIQDESLKQVWKSKAQYWFEEKGYFPQFFSVT
jgi:hypothetical protein